MRWNTTFNLVAGLFCVVAGGGLIAFLWPAAEQGATIGVHQPGRGIGVGAVVVAVGLGMLGRAVIKLRAR